LKKGGASERMPVPLLTRMAEGVTGDDGP
jgi:hypothetical protein